MCVVALSNQSSAALPNVFFFSVFHAHDLQIDESVKNTHFCNSSPSHQNQVPLSVWRTGFSTSSTVYSPWTDENPKAHHSTVSQQLANVSVLYTEVPTAILFLIWWFNWGRKILNFTAVHRTGLDNASVSPSISHAWRRGGKVPPCMNIFSPTQCAIVPPHNHLENRVR